jgi:hypothetical protein
MSTNDHATWFSDLSVLGAMPLEEAALRLRHVGEAEAAEALEAAAQRGAALESTGRLRWPFRDRPWQHTAHAFGYLRPTAPGGDLLAIQDAGNIEPEQALRGARVRITLDRLRVADYPGDGTHHVLFDFYAQNAVPGDVEHLHFNATYRVREGEQAGIRGYPIFVGLNVGREGLAFKCFTVNVRNDNDEAFLAFLESDIFRSGLKLVETAQPAIAPFSQMAYSLTRAVAGRNRNQPVQDFYLGLDFEPIATRARLATGSYLAVQIPEALSVVWDWGEWVFNPANGQIVHRDDTTRLIPNNYLVFSVSRYDDGG